MVVNPVKTNWPSSTSAFVKESSPMFQPVALENVSRQAGWPSAVRGSPAIGVGVWVGGWGGVGVVVSVDGIRVGGSVAVVGEVATGVSTVTSGCVGGGEEAVACTASVPLTLVATRSSTFTGVDGWARQPARARAAMRASKACRLMVSFPNAAHRPQRLALVEAPDRLLNVHLKNPPGEQRRNGEQDGGRQCPQGGRVVRPGADLLQFLLVGHQGVHFQGDVSRRLTFLHAFQQRRSEEHTSELQSRLHLVCRLLLEKKKT